MLLVAAGVGGAGEALRGILLILLLDILSGVYFSLAWSSLSVGLLSYLVFSLSWSCLLVGILSQ